VIETTSKSRTKTETLLNTAFLLEYTYTLIEQRNPIEQSQRLNTMASMRAATPSMLGIPSELKNKIYGLVADDPNRKPIILGRKVAQAAKQFLFDGDIRAQALFAIVQHPLEMTCHQTRAEFQTGFHVDFARHRTYEFVVDNFDFEQLELFEELQYTKHGDRFRMVKSRSQMQRDRDLKWMSWVSFELRFQMNHGVVASATNFAKSIMLCSEGKEFFNVPINFSFLAVDHFAMSFRYRDLLIGARDQAESTTTAQATEAFKILRKWRKDRNCSVPLIFRLLMAFTALLDVHAWHKSQHKDQLVSLAAQLGL
jgi:hypothetical protein